MKDDILTICRFTWRKFRYSPRYRLLLLGGCVIAWAILFFFRAVFQDSLWAWIAAAIVCLAVLVPYYMRFDTYKE